METLLLNIKMVVLFNLTTNFILLALMTRREKMYQLLVHFLALEIYLKIGIIKGEDSNNAYLLVSSFANCQLSEG